MGSSAVRPCDGMKLPCAIELEGWISPSSRREVNTGLLIMFRRWDDGATTGSQISELVKFVGKTPFCLVAV